MKTIESVMKLIDFAIVKSDIECVFPSDGDEKIVVNEGYDVDVDCNLIQGEDPDVFLVKIALKVNEKRDKGYYIDVVGISAFTFKEKMSKEEKTVLLQRSGVQIAISNIRAYVASVTSYYPFGKYMFHSIDLNDFIRRKAEEAKRGE